ncbi:DNA integration/recombination/invertion protein [Acetobacter senegalensis]|uniref:DNA integration/recombination/invertion protein n=1 Tax=Acetobacter senegalensis TaxID=446692 RepID=A0A0U5B8D1_9PROT|nr:DNA integration/recombination/invertion protein [Acetobacter senegalensis]
MIDCFGAQEGLILKDQITSRKIDPATGRSLPADVEYRGKAQYPARKRIAGGERIHQTFASVNWSDDGFMQHPPNLNSASFRIPAGLNARPLAN